MYCTKGHENPGSAKFCVVCGDPLGGSGPVAVALPAGRPTNGMAIASLVLGIVWAGWIGSILAVILGFAASKRIRERHEGGDGLALAGIILGWVGIATLIVTIVLIVAGMHHTTTY